MSHDPICHRCASGHRNEVEEVTVEGAIAANVRGAEMPSAGTDVFGSSLETEKL